MKKEFIKHDDVTYEIRSMGFFKANTLLMGSLMPLIPLIGDVAGAIKGGIDSMEDTEMSALLLKLLTSINAEELNALLSEIFSEVYVDNKKFDPDTIEDYELPIKIIPVIYKLNFSTLGKLIGKMLTDEETPLPEE